MTNAALPSVLRSITQTFSALLVIAAPALCAQDDAKQTETTRSTGTAGGEVQQDAKASERPKPNVVAGGLRRPQPTANPKANLTFAPGSTTYDFGHVLQGDELTHTFVLKSTGEEPAIISQASPSCGCLIGQIKTRPPGTKTFSSYELGAPILPGTEVTMEMVVQTLAKNGKTQITINVSTNEARRSLLLTLKAEIQPILRSSPMFVQLGDIPMSEARTAYVDFTTSRGEKMILSFDETRKVLMPVGFSRELSPVAPDADGKSNRWRVTVHVAADAEEGPRGHALTLVSDIKLPDTAASAKRRAGMTGRGGKVSPRATFFSIMTIVSYRKLGALSISPPSLSMGLVQPGAVTVRKIKLLAADAHFDLSKVTFELRGLQGQPLRWAEHFSTSTQPVAGMNAIEITVSLADLPAGASGAITGELVIRTGHPDKPELTVRLSGVVR